MLEFVKMLIDAHIHVGTFEKCHFSPTYVSSLMNSLGCDCYAVSSTSMCEEDYIKVLDEINDLIHIDGNKVLPIMWITPEGLRGNIAWFLESKINWHCLKIHPFLNQYDWEPGSQNLQEVLDIARELNIPLLIHTGNEECCRAGKYETIIQKNPDITFILAHGRPHLDAIHLTTQYANAYADSAFMSIDEMEDFVKRGLAHKLLWGTDMCIPQHFYPQIDLESYYKQKLDAFRCICSKEQFDDVTYRNALTIFRLSS